MNITIGTGTAVHSTTNGTATCGAGVHRAANTGRTRVLPTRTTDAEVTCRNCRKAPVTETAAPSAPVSTVWCWKCDEDITGTAAEIRTHTKNCKH